MRRHGWAGSPPHSDTEARERIVDAAMRCVDRYGPHKTGLSDVASELGVTRQTVYRYFANTEELLTAVAAAGAEDYLDRLAVHVGQITEPDECIVEAIAYTLEHVPTERHLGLLLATGRSEVFARRLTSPEAFAFTRMMLTRTAVRWDALGYDDAELDSLVEFTLRIVQSLVIDPGPRSDDPERLRDFLRRWVAPGIVRTPRKSSARRRSAAG
ncbi:MAG TPA: TetR/AcrR family transcriptional regulator [Rugosimonospora sp.]|nr:TetR/AcrR family transcriptional regulator [Rugosimonospora sp.]